MLQAESGRCVTGSRSNALRGSTRRHIGSQFAGMDAWRHHVREFTGSSHEYLLFPVVLDPASVLRSEDKAVNIGNIQRCHAVLAQHTLSRVGKGKLVTFGAPDNNFAEFPKRRASVSAAHGALPPWLPPSWWWRGSGFEVFPHPSHLIPEGEMVPLFSQAALPDGISR